MAVTNLVTYAGGTRLDELAHERTGKMVGDLCGTLFTQADVAINQNLPELLTCPRSVTAATPNESRTAKTEAATALRERIAAFDQKTATLKAEMAMRTHPAEEDDGLVADNLTKNDMAEDDTAGDDPADDGVTAAHATDGEASLPASKPVVIAQLESYQRYEPAVSGVAILHAKISRAIADIRIDIAEARLVNDMPFFRLFTQRLTKLHSNRVCAAMRHAGLSCMLRGRKQIC